MKLHFSLSRGSHALVLAVLGLLTAVPEQLASAQTLSFLRDSAVADFEEQDFVLLRTALREALATGKPGEHRAWSNPATGNHGEVTVLETVASKGNEGTPCRMARLENHSKTKRGGGDFKFCRQPDGTWKNAP